MRYEQTTAGEDDKITDNNNNGNLQSTYPAAQSAEQAYTHNVHRDGKIFPPQKTKTKCIY